MPRGSHEYCELDREVFALLKSFGFEPKTIFDVGASGGYWSKMIAPVFPTASFHLFEPLVDHLPRYRRDMEEHLRQHPSFTLHKTALGDTSGETRMSVFPGGVGSTSLVIADGHPGVSRVAVPVRRLDDVVRELRLPTPQVIKMDVQGAELSVLKGARPLLAEVDVILAECWLWRGYGENTPLLMEIAAWLAGFGFCLWDIGDAYREPDGILTSLDCFFVNLRTMTGALGHRLGLPVLSGPQVQVLLRTLQARESEIAAMRASRVWKLRDRWRTLTRWYRRPTLPKSK
jgi:FkbM family methyltransferase